MLAITYEATISPESHRTTIVTRLAERLVFILPYDKYKFDVVYVFVSMINNWFLSIDTINIPTHEHEVNFYT